MAKSKTIKTIETEIETINISVPLVTPSGSSYLARYVGIQNRSLTLRQRMGLAKLTNGLKAENATLQDGKPVLTKTDAIRWMLEQMG